jgi:uncharacterized membrane protein YjjP (DUF1212 family)
MLVRPTTCKSGAQTLDGSKYSSMKTTNSLIGRIAKYLMLEVPRMKKVKQSKSRVTMVVKAKDGELSILTKLVQSNLRDSTRTSVSTLTDHSISSQNFHSTELLSALVPTMLP